LAAPASDADSLPAAEAAAAETIHGEFKPASFIDQYAHTLEEGEADEQQPTSSPVSSPAAAQPLQPAHGLSLGDADEESIEQYMAKLMQRMRGDTVPVPSSQGPQAKPAALGWVTSPNRSTTAATAGLPAKGPSLPPAADTSDDDPASRPFSSLEELKRRLPAPEHKTDMKALRQLANETARRAIVKHATHTHRKAVWTKLFVAVFAGITALYLMAHSSDWKSLQFGGAGVALVVSLYWAFLTLGSLTDSARTRTYQRWAEKDVDQAEEEKEQSWDPLLPIDVDSKRPDETQVAEPV
jgi:hypothetical protein